MKLMKRRVALIAATVVALAGAAVGATASMAGEETQQAGGHHLILVGGSCDGDASDMAAWAGGTHTIAVLYPAGGLPQPGCDMTPMDQSVNIGHENAKRVVVDSFNQFPGDTFTIASYSQGGMVANRVLDDIAADRLPVDKSRYSAKFYADPGQPVGPPGTGIGANIPKGMGLPSPFGGYISPGAASNDFGGIPFVRYCIETDGVCHFNTLEAPGGYIAQHPCYGWKRPTDGRSIMGDTLNDGFFNNGSVSIGKQDCVPLIPPAA